MDPPQAATRGRAQEALGVHGSAADPPPRGTTAWQLLSTPSSAIGWPGRCAWGAFVGSRVTQRRSTPLEWRDDWDETNAHVREVQDWLDSLPPVMRTLREGEIEALRILAARGELVEGDTERFEPVARFPDVYELKWRFRSPGKPMRHLRQYHVEPSSHPAHLVAVHRHFKDVSGSKHEVKEAQNAEMAQAKLRALGRAHAEWGI